MLIPVADLLSSLPFFVLKKNLKNIAKNLHTIKTRCIFAIIKQQTHTNTL